MHEYSLVKSLLAQAADVMNANNGIGVESIRVELGPLSGVEAMLVELAFEQLVDATPCRGATLEIDETPLCCECQTCGHSFNMDDFRFICPECRSRSIRIVRGDEFRLVDVTICTRDVPDLVKP